jgi:hypothetical protein
MTEQAASGADKPHGGTTGGGMEVKAADDGEDIPYRPLRPTSIDFKAEPADRKVVLYC